MSRTGLLQAVDRAGAQATDLRALWHAADAALRPVLGHEVAAWATLDPSTLLWTSCETIGIDHDPRRESVLFDCEYGGDDLVRIADLAVADCPAASVHACTGGDLSRSRRHRVLLGPFGVTDELRLVLRTEDRCWGSLCAYRTDGVFDAATVELAASLSAPLASAVRRLLLVRLDGPPDAGPGTLVVDAGGRLRTTTEAAEALLARVDRDRLPAAVRSVVAAARGGRDANVDIGTDDGEWISLHAMATKGDDGDGDGDVTVIVEPTRPPALASVIVDAYGLTQREREVLGELLRAEPVKRIARRLGLSEHTVRDHLKHIYAKVGGHSRHEVARRIFHEHYLPRTRSGCAPSPFGFFTDHREELHPTGGPDR